MYLVIKKSNSMKTNVKKIGNIFYEIVFFRLQTKSDVWIIL